MMKAMRRGAAGDRGCDPPCASREFRVFGSSAAGPFDNRTAELGTALGDKGAVNGVVTRFVQNCTPPLSPKDSDVALDLDAALWGPTQVGVRRLT